MVYDAGQAVDVEEGKKGEHDIAFIFGATLPGEVEGFAGFAHGHIGDNVRMAEHNALGMTSGARRVDEESEVLSRVNLSPSISICACDISDGREMFELVGRVFLVANQDDSVVRDASCLGSFSSDIQEGSLRCKCTCTRIFELKS